uniref:Uncharacterized protein n=1 Tax=Globodera rostochiensis TaxID=31243 RepID=A0A914I7U2_GLORO
MENHNKILTFAPTPKESSTQQDAGGYGLPSEGMQLNSFVWILLAVLGVIALLLLARFIFSVYVHNSSTSSMNFFSYIFATAVLSHQTISEENVTQTAVLNKTVEPAPNVTLPPLAVVKREVVQEDLLENVDHPDPAAADVDMPETVAKRDVEQQQQQVPHKAANQTGPQDNGGVYAQPIFHGKEEPVQFSLLFALLSLPNVAQKNAADTLYDQNDGIQSNNDKEFMESDQLKESKWFSACLLGQLDTVKLFVENGQDIEATASDGTTGLIAASREGKANVVRFLLSKGARVDRTNAKGFSSLHWAARAGAGMLDVCKELVANGADTNQVSGDGVSPWMAACWTGNLDIVKLFVENGQDIEATNSDGTTGLIAASREGKANVVRFLLSKGARVDRTNAKGFSSLLWAVIADRLDVCKELVANGADTNQVSGDGVSPWMAACWTGNLDIVKFFVENGQDIEATARNGLTGLMYASDLGKADLVRFLLSKGARVARTSTKDGHEEL